MSGSGNVVELTERLVRSERSSRRDAELGEAFLYGREGSIFAEDAIQKSARQMLVRVDGKWRKR